MSRAGLSTKLLIGEDPDGYVSAAAWAKKLAEGLIVGICHCGRPTRPLPPLANANHDGGLIWYPAFCTAGHTRLASGARPTREHNGRPSP